MRKLINILLILIIAVPFNGYSSAIAAAATDELPPGKYSIGEILAHDSDDHPTDFASAMDQYNAVSSHPKAPVLTNSPNAFYQANNHSWNKH